MTVITRLAVSRLPIQPRVQLFPLRTTIVPSQLWSLWNLIMSSNGNSQITSELSTKKGSVSDWRWSRARARGPAERSDETLRIIARHDSNLFLVVQFPERLWSWYLIVWLPPPSRVEAYQRDNSRLESHDQHQPRVWRTFLLRPISTMY